MFTLDLDLDVSISRDLDLVPTRLDHNQHTSLIPLDSEKKNIELLDLVRSI